MEKDKISKIIRNVTLAPIMAFVLLSILYANKSDSIRFRSLTHYLCKILMFII